MLFISPLPYWYHVIACKQGILKGESQGHNVILKGLKMAFRTKILKKRNYTTLISIKNTTNFILTTFLYNHFFFTTLLITVNFNFCDDPSAALGGEQGEQLW